ncbi:hypothetical protein MRB53_039298 [Persea americana]|nr:hypothetical protein MRB53_039298 [Persea americana]
MPESKIRTTFAFPLIVATSLFTSAVLNTVVAQFTNLEVGQVSRTLTKEWQAGAVLAWKVLELALAWFSGLDESDILAFTVLTHLPQVYLLHTFYLVPALPLAAHLATSLIANALPFRLLRRDLPAHTTGSPVTSSTLTLVTTTILGSLLYIIPLYFSLDTWLPTHLAIHFDGLRTLDPAHSASVPSLVMLPLLSLPLGLAARTFLFTTTALNLPSTTTSGQSTTGKPISVFDPAEASLAQTLEYNFLWWRYLSPRTRVWLERSTLLVFWTAANTGFLAYANIEGTEELGALGWGGLWSAGAAIASATLGWVAGVY